MLKWVILLSQYEIWVRANQPFFSHYSYLLIQINLRTKFSLMLFLTLI